MLLLCSPARERGDKSKPPTSAQKPRNPTLRKILSGTLPAAPPPTACFRLPDSTAPLRSVQIRPLPDKSSSAPAEWDDGAWDRGKSASQKLPDIPDWVSR